MRKELKRQARKNLKRHYGIFAAVCLIAAFLGSEFSGSLSAVTSHSASPGGAETAVVTSAPGALPEAGLTEVLEEWITGGREAGAALSGELLQREEASAGEGSVLGRSRGVFAYLLNAVSSGSFLVTALTALNSLLGSESAGLAVLVLLSLAAMFAVWFFLYNMFTAVSRRLFLEGRLYEKVPVQRLLFLFRVKRWTKVSCTMFVASLFQFMWSLTLVGGFIKRYSYFLVPCLAAENPDIAPLEAVSLSRRMMKGHKWECFVFELSFLGWDLLGALTLGLTGIFYSNPYRAAAFTEYYALLRSKTLEQRPEEAALLNDRYLFALPDRETVAAAYADVLELMDRPEEDMAELKGFRGFLARNFGVLLGRSPEEEAFEASQAARIRIRARRDAVEGRAYPGRLFPIPENEKREKAETMHYLRHYTVWSLLAMFFLFSLVGWVWEVALHLISEHQFVNRGVLQGPWLPIYGAGGLLILVLLNRFRSRPAVEFLCAVILCGIVEYGTAYVLELTHGGHKWWDYSGYFLNLHGRICAEGLLVFGLGGMAVVYLLAPMLDNWLRRFPVNILAPVCLALLLLFAADQLYSSKHPNTGKGITDEVSAPAAACILPLPLRAEARTPWN